MRRMLLRRARGDVEDNLLEIAADGIPRAPAARALIKDRHDAKSDEYADE